MNIQTISLKAVLKKYRQTHQDKLLALRAKETRSLADECFLEGFIAALKQVETNIIKALENDHKDAITEAEDEAQDRADYEVAMAKLNLGDYLPGD